MEATVEREKQRAHDLAEEYRRKGYEVIEEPSSEHLPDFLSGYHPDLLVRKGSKVVIVEVKSRTSLAKDPQVRDLARLLHAKPGWNFELVVVGEGEQLNVPEGACPLEREDIRQRLEGAEKLLNSGAAEAALLLAWSATEAIVRLLIEEDGLTLDRSDLLSILKQAVTNGVISREDYDFLMRAVKYRSALVHGFKITDLDPVLIRDLISTTKRFLLSEH